jgi:hypothetical protein
LPSEISIDDGKQIISFVVHIASPGEQIMSWTGSGLDRSLRIYRRVPSALAGAFDPRQYPL